MDDRQKRNNDINQEILAYSEYIDNLLGHIKELTPKYLPVSNSDNKQGVKVNDLLDSLRDGILFGYILSQINPDSINLDKLDRDIDLSGFDDNKSIPTSTDRAKVVFKVTANHNIILESAKKCGIVVVNIGSEDILQKNVGLVLGLLWQMIRCILLSEINIDSHPELVVLLDPEESIEMAGQISNEQLLLRWFNFHLIKNGAKPISNFAKDISDSEAYFTLFERLNMTSNMNDEVMSLISKGRGLPNSEKEKRAEYVLKIADIMDCKRFININRIVNGHARLNISFVATIFNKYSNVNLSNEESMEYVKNLIRRLYEKEKEHYLPLDQEIEYIKKILSDNNYLTSEFCRLYSDRIGQLNWLNEYGLDDTYEKPEGEPVPKKMSEVERRNKMIEDIKAQIEEKNKLIEEMTKKNEDACQNIEEYNKKTEELGGLIENLNNDITEKNTKIEEMTKSNEELDNKIKEMEELNEKQKESFKTFKKNAAEQLHLIESMMKKDMSQINKMDIQNENESENEGNAEIQNDEEILSNLQKEISNYIDTSLNDTYRKVEANVKQLLEELKKSKEQNYIFKSQIAQNDKINAILNEKIYKYSEQACQESNAASSPKGKNTNANKKKFIPS
ncbi:calponin homology domain-containing protein [Neocallimastix lanati (nom. inval.)]|nr:calponin homology domain-containing protein [Neocallimastix sp. JGI-2020a]